MRAVYVSSSKVTFAGIKSGKNSGMWKQKSEFRFSLEYRARASALWSLGLQELAVRVSGDRAFGSTSWTEVRPRMPSEASCESSPNSRFSIVG